MFLVCFAPRPHIRRVAASPCWEVPSLGLREQIFQPPTRRDLYSPSLQAWQAQVTVKCAWFAPQTVTKPQLDIWSLLQDEH